MLHRVISYLKFLLASKPLIGHGIHSPFVYRLASEVLRNSAENLDKLRMVGDIRSKMLENKQKISLIDLGAGKTKGSDLRIKDIARSSSGTSRDYQWLHALAKDLQPESILEMGTSLGLASISLALACPNIPIVSIEGDSAIANIAKNNMQLANIENVTVVNASFDDVLPSIIPTLKKPFLAFIDGNHAYEPTIKYFNLLAEQASSGSLIVLHDIYWSKEMERAWEEIQKDSRATISIDLYRMGLLYFRDGVPKQHFKIGRG